MSKISSGDRNRMKYGTISLPMPLIDRIKQKMQGTGIPSVSAYVSFILRQILSEPSKRDIMDSETEEKIKDRLKSLGYI